MVSGAYDGRFVWFRRILSDFVVFRQISLDFQRPWPATQRHKMSEQTFDSSDFHVFVVFFVRFTISSLFGSLVPDSALQFPSKTYCRRKTGFRLLYFQARAIVARNTVCVGRRNSYFVRFRRFRPIYDLVAFLSEFWVQGSRFRPISSTSSDLRSRRFFVRVRGSGVRYRNRRDVSRFL